MEADQFVPVGVRFAPTYDPIVGKQMATALAATPVRSAFSIDPMEMIADDSHKHMTLCIGAIVMEPGREAQQAHKFYSTANDPWR